MSWTAHQLPYRDTGYFSSLILDYLDHHASLRPFISHQPDIRGILQSVQVRKQFPTNRSWLVEQLTKKYESVPANPAVNDSLEKLRHENTFTITTAHQPNLLTGPLYVVYKIMHVIKLADHLNKQIPDHHFVPVFYMGSEDADFDELGHFTVQGKKYQWNTQQQGAFGRMLIDKSLTHLLDSLEAQLGSLPHANDMMHTLRSFYAEGKTIAEATFAFIHHLFGKYGLIVLIPDANSFKSCFISEMKDDLMHHSADHILQEVKSSFPYPAEWQANARAINLFYLNKDVRERIEQYSDGYHVVNTDIQFGQADMIRHLEDHPDHFSPNVILRPLYQEKLLPNIATIGGSGELAYWLQLKKVFDHYQIPYPVLLLRHSLLMMNDSQEERFQKIGFAVNDIFRSADDLLLEYVRKHSGNDLSLAEESLALKNLFESIQAKASVVDPTLKPHTGALLRGVEKKLLALEKKMLRAEKRRYEDAGRQIRQVKSQLFPEGALQERKESMLSYFALMGNKWIDELYAAMPAIDQQMTTMIYPASY